MKPNIGKQKTVTGSYSDQKCESGDKFRPDTMYSLAEIDNQGDSMNTTGFTGPAPKGKSPK